MRLISKNDKCLLFRRLKIKKYEISYSYKVLFAFCILLLNICIRFFSVYSKIGMCGFW